MPFIVPVIENVLPFVHRALITMSVHADKKTQTEVGKLLKRNPDKVKLYYEDVPVPSMLTEERQKLLDKTYEDWVFFLDDDDWWEPKDLKDITDYLEADIDGLAVNPYQVVDEKHYDKSWDNKWFTKFFKNGADVHYRHPWPKDLIYKGDEKLYWKTNPRVPRIPIKYYHLSYIKDKSFRTEAWAKKYELKPSKLAEFEKEDLRYVRHIFKNKYGKN